MKIVKSALIVKENNVMDQARALDNDVNKIVQCLQGRVRFGTGVDGDRGENIHGEWQVVADTGVANTEFTVAHTIGAVPIGYIVTKIDKAGVIYDSGSAWTSSNIYLKSSVANCAVTLFLLQ